MQSLTRAEEEILLEIYEADTAEDDLRNPSASLCVRLQQAGYIKSLGSGKYTITVAGQNYALAKKLV